MAEQFGEKISEMPLTPPSGNDLIPIVRTGDPTPNRATTVQALGAALGTGSATGGIPIEWVNNTSGAPITFFLPDDRSSIKIKDDGGNATAYPITVVDRQGALIDHRPVFMINQDSAAYEFVFNTLTGRWGVF